MNVIWACVSSLTRWWCCPSSLRGQFKLPFKRKGDWYWAVCLLNFSCTAVCNNDLNVFPIASKIVDAVCIVIISKLAVYYVAVIILCLASLWDCQQRIAQAYDSRRWSSDCPFRDSWQLCLDIIAVKLRWQQTYFCSVCRIFHKLLQGVCPIVSFCCKISCCHTVDIYNQCAVVSCCKQAEG